ncbi:MAG: class I SAM-dependent methyltransferase [Planctomycetota bacterium]
MASEARDPAPDDPLSTAAWAAARGAKWAAHIAGMEAMLAPVDAPLVAALALDRPCRIADLGCGGGATSLAILDRAPAGSRVHGVDISPDLIAHARGRAPAGAAVAFECADLAPAAPPGGPFERLVSRFGLMFFDEPPAAFANLARWLLPGGRFAFAVWAAPADNAWVASVREVVAGIVDVPRTPPDAPGLFRYADPAGLVVLLQRSGFAEVEVSPWRGDLRIGGGLPAADAATFALAAFANFGELLAAAGAEAGRRAHRELAQRWHAAERRGEVALPACVHVLTGSVAR